MKHFITKLLLITLAVFVSSVTDMLAQSTIYVGGHFRRDRPNTITTLKASGFNTAILFNVEVDASGNLSMDGEALCTNGVYTFAATQPNYVSDVTSLKTGTTSINRIETCVGGWGSNSYTNIRNLINAQGTGSGTNLYRNFQALKNAIPAIDVINNDEETTYDVSTATAFSVMLADIGFKTSLAPYTNKSYWQQVATNVNNQRPGAVDRVYIQCYDGGASNNPCDWHLGNIPLHAGMLHFNSTATISSQMTAWKQNCNVVGGFLWVYNANDFNLQNYASTINNVFTGTPDPDRALVMYQHCDWGGWSVALPAGNYTLAQLQALGYTDNQLSSFTLGTGYQAIFYTKDNFTGTAYTATASDNCLVNENLNDSTTSLRVQSTGSFNRTIEAESYSSMAGIQTETCTEGGLNVGYIETADWMAYNSITIPTTGTYLIEYRVASQSGGGRLSLDINAGATVLGYLDIPSTGGWQNWTTLSHTVSITAGTYNFGIYAQAGGWNINWWRITRQSSAAGARTAVASHEITSLSEEKAGSFLYPNPTHGSIQLTYSGKRASLSIHDALGHEVVPATAVQSGETVDIAHLDKGLYLVQVEVDGVRRTERIIKK